MPDKTFYVISYDIVCNKKRNRVANVLKDYGIRIQKSVFECMLDAKALKELLGKIGEIIDKKTDSVLVYMQCAACVGKNRFLGTKPIHVYALNEEYEIL